MTEFQCIQPGSQLSLTMFSAFRVIWFNVFACSIKCHGKCNFFYLKVSSEMCLSVGIFRCFTGTSGFFLSWSGRLSLYLSTLIDDPPTPPLPGPLKKQPWSALAVCCLLLLCRDAVS